MTSEELFVLTCALREKADAVLALRRELLELAGSKAYQRWSSGLEQGQPFELPLSIENDYPTLKQLGILKPLREGDHFTALRLKVNLVPLRGFPDSPKSGVFLTDGVWQPAGWRAFPFSDESQSLVHRALELDWHKRCDLVLDLAAGCGHSALSMPLDKSASFDINPRALSFIELNKLLNGRDPKAHQAVLADLLKRTPEHYAKNAERGLLVFANVPFAPAAHARALPLTSNGGEDALDFQQAVFRTLVAMRKELAPGVRLHALILGMCAGDASRGDWLLEKAARSVLNPGNDAVHWSFRPLSKERLLRIDGKRAIENPTTVETAMEAFSRCRLYHPQEQQRQALKASFRRLARDFRESGHVDFSYGMLEICLDSRIKGGRA